MTVPDDTAENGERPDHPEADESRAFGRAADTPVYGPADVDDEL